MRKDISIILPVRASQFEKSVLLSKGESHLGCSVFAIGSVCCEGESPEQAAIRAAIEHVGLSIPEKSLEKEAEIAIVGTNSDTLLFVFSTKNWNGNPSVTGGSTPIWFSTECLPLLDMPCDVAHWMPFVVSGNKVKMYFSFTDTGKLRTSLVQVVGNWGSQ